MGFFNDFKRGVSEIEREVELMEGILAGRVSVSAYAQFNRLEQPYTFGEIVGMGAARSVTEGTYLAFEAKYGVPHIQDTS